MINNYSIFNYNKKINNIKIIKISDFIKEPKLNLNLKEFLIYLDIDYNELLNHIEIIIKELIYKIYFYHKNYILLTKMPLKTIENIPPLNKLLHNNKLLLNKYLLLEQFFNILKETSIIIDCQTKEQIIPIKKINKTYKDYPLENLNNEQLTSVKQVNGPHILLAPAGSGKTKTLVNRIVYLINQGIDSKNILVLAFNKKAELELSSRLYKNFKLKTNIKTFHSFGNQIIKKYLNYEFDINYEQKNLEIIKKISANKLNNLEIFSSIKNNLLTKLDITDLPTWNLYNNYLNECQKEKFYTFDDMIYLPIKLMLENKNIRKEIQNQYQYILVDEFQDLNKAQLMLINIITKPQDNLFVVGDDDQMIYRFRGADEKIILDFPNKYGICFQNILTTNYRCPASIVANARKLINYNQKRIVKNTKAFQKEQGIINLIIEDDIIKETKKIVQFIKKNKKNNNYRDFAILYRYHQYGDLIKVVLKQNNLPVIDSDLELLKTKVGQIIFSYLKLIIELKPSMKTIHGCLKQFDINLPNLFLKQIKNIDDIFNKKIFMKYLNRKQLTNYKQFINKIKIFRNDNNIDLKSVIKAFDLENYFKQNNIIDYQTASNQETLKIILKISDILGNIKEVYNYFTNKNNHKNNDNIVLTTIHRTKGNEYKNVIYFHVVQNNSDLIEDERRLFYVAVTRAEKKLLITSIKNEISPFIKEYFLNEKLNKYSNEALILILSKFNFRQAILDRNIEKTYFKIKQYKKLKQLINAQKELNVYKKLLKERKINIIIINELKKEINYRKLLI